MAGSKCQGSNMVARVCLAKHCMSGTSELMRSGDPSSCSSSSSSPTLVVPAPKPWAENPMRALHIAISLTCGRTCAASQTALQTIVRAGLGHGLLCDVRLRLCDSDRQAAKAGRALLLAEAPPQAPCQDVEEGKCVGLGKVCGQRSQS